ncbi:hypothetical protein [Bifidobacterium moukalabense]|nr:hypothetical protein [Bifidobacterium moukalabense]
MTPVKRLIGLTAEGARYAVTNELSPFWPDIMGLEKSPTNRRWYT